MKYIALALLCAATAFSIGLTYADDAVPPNFRTIVSCPLADGTRVTLKAESHGDDGDALFVDEGGKTQPAFLDMPDTQFVGNVALARCVGGALVFALEYGPPYLKGVAIRRNPKTHADERIYFAEKALPRWLYLNNQEMLVVIPNEGQETDKKYLVYQYVSGKGQPNESTATDQLPVPIRALLSVRPR